MQQIIQRVQSVRDEIALAVRRRGAANVDPRLVAVSKTRTAADIRAAHAAGVTDFGENYLQEALPKIEACADLPLAWHFIGAVQSNKTRAIARHFDWVQTIDRARIVERLGRERPAELGALNVLIQVNVDDEPQKAGVRPERLAELLDAVTAHASLRLRGLMAIPRPDATGRAAPASFARMATLFDEVAASRMRASQALDHWDTLSMGMTNDFGDAIVAGATMVRVGTGIFGARTKE
jgi:PLP dependent protein